MEGGTQDVGGVKAGVKWDIGARPEGAEVEGCIVDGFKAIPFYFSRRKRGRDDAYVLFYKFKARISGEVFSLDPSRPGEDSTKSDN